MYDCQECKFQATSRVRINRHQKSIHEGLKYKCIECNFKGRDLKTHMKLLHDNINSKFQCKECDYQVSIEALLKRHHDSVQKRITYQCSECTYQATRKSDLKSHKEAIHY